MRVLCLCLCVCLLVAWSAALGVDRFSSNDQNIAMQPHAKLYARHEDPLSGQLGDRASLLFRALDRDSDRKISSQDVLNSASRLRVHMPGVGVEAFLSFLEIADVNGDQVLSRDELLQALADGLEESKTLPVALESQPNLLELSTDLQKVQTGKKIGSTSTTSSGSKAAKTSTGVSTSSTVGVSALNKAKAWAKSKVSAKAEALHKVKTKVTGAVDTSQDKCVMCQYIIERCENNIKLSGVIPAYSPIVSFDSYLELDAQVAQMPGSPRQSMSGPPGGGASGSGGQMDEAQAVADQALIANTVSYAVDSMDDVSTLTPLDDLTPVEELDNEPSLSSMGALLEVQEKQLHFDQTAAGIIGSARQATRVQRQLERQKYNEIYRVVDISLDDVCEQGMPNSFYGFCKQIYKVQTDVVDGFRYQYRPSDICFRIGMCGKDSYITKGLHSRYK